MRKTPRETGARRAARAAVAAACFAWAPPVGARGVTTPGEWERIWGWTSGIRSRETACVRDAKSWESLWERHTGRSAREFPPPEVDFRREIVVAVFLGERRTGGVRVEMSLRGAPSRPAPHGGPEISRLLVTYRGSGSHGGGFQPQVFSQPFEFRRVRILYDVVDFVEAPPSPGGLEHSASQSSGSHGTRRAGGAAERLGPWLEQGSGGVRFER